jgi:hypothetical protein
LAERLRVAEEKANRVPELEAELEKKNRMIAFLEQEVGARAVGCLRCDQRRVQLAKMRRRVAEGH